MLQPFKVLKIDAKLIFFSTIDSLYHRYAESSTPRLNDTRSRRLPDSMMTLRITDTASFLLKNSLADSQHPSAQWNLIQLKIVRKLNKRRREGAFFLKAVPNQVFVTHPSLFGYVTYELEEEANIFSGSGLLLPILSTKILLAYARMC
jgi:hypothetical protein